MAHPSSSSDAAFTDAALSGGALSGGSLLGGGLSAGGLSGAARGSDVLLADGSTVHIRQITPQDADRVVAMHARFSDRTRYLRYFSPYPRIPPRDLDRFVNVDHVDREALVIATGSPQRLIAVGRYERLGPSAPDAEVAFVVEDAFQGQGIAPLLLEHLAEAARSAGITRFVAEVLPENRPMLRVLHEAGYQVSREWADGVVHLTFPIEPTPSSEQRQRSREQRPEAASIARILSPRSIAVYGVRHDGTGAGAVLARHVVDGGFTGPVYAVRRVPAAAASPRSRSPSAPRSWTYTRELISNHTHNAKVDDGVDLALVAVRADDVPAAVADAGAAGAHAAVVISAGFAETVDGAAVQLRLLALARAHGMRLVGPNCLGVLNTDPVVSLNATFAPRLAPQGRVGVFCQSAAMGIALLSEVDERGLGLSTFASAGNRADVSGNDFLQYWRDDPHTDVVLLYLETFGNPHKFARLARDMVRDKPIVAVAAGAAAGPGSGSDRVAWPVGRQPEDEAVSALFAHSGVIRVETVTELLDVGQILASCPLPAGSRVGVVGNSAALVQLADAACVRAGLGSSFARWLAPNTDPFELEVHIRVALASDEVDTVLAVIAPPLPGRTVEDALTALARAVAGADKPVIAVVVGGACAAKDPVPRFRTVEEAVRALARVARYAAWRRQPVGSVVSLSGVDSAAARSVVASQGSVSSLLAAYGVPLLPSESASSPDAALAAASSLGYPVAVKVADPTLGLRSDLGAVRLDVDGPRSLTQAYEDLAARFGPDVLVQPMAPHGVACVVSVVDDPSFGPVVGFSVGGIATELLGDVAWRVAPLTDVDAASLVRSPRAAALLGGYRGAPPVDLRAIEDLLLRIGQLADENPGVQRLTLNPVLVHSSGLTVVHAWVVYGEPAPRPDTGPRRLG